MATSGAFVGRRRDLSELESVLEAALAGHGELVLVPGEAGIGKTRLAEEVAERARAAGIGVAWAGCTEAEVAPAFWPWAQLLRTLVADDPDLGLLPETASGPLGKLLPETAGRRVGAPRSGGGRGRSPAQGGEAAQTAAGEDVTWLADDPETARLELFDAVASVVRAAARRGPRLLVLDDLHWADAPSVLLLAFVAPLLRAVPAVLLGTYRDVDVPAAHPFAEALPDLARHGRRLALGGLSSAEVADLVASVTGVEPEAAAAAALCRHTGGNPLLARELLRLLAPSGGRLAMGEETLTRSVPEGARGILRRRLEGLSDGCREVVRTGAAIGQEFTIDLVAAATGRPAEELLEHLDEAVAARVVHDAGPGRCAFSHALMRGAAYGELGLARRVRLHQQVGEALEDRRERGLRVDPAELARHFLLAAPGGVAAKALAYAREAADRAMAVLAYEDAAHLYEQALEAAELDPAAGGAERIELLLCLGDARVAAGDRPGARAAYAGAASRARAAARPDQLARAALGMGSGPAGFEVSLFDREQIDLLEEALAALQETSALGAWVMARLSVALSYSAEVERRLALSEEAVALGRKVGEDAALAYSLAAHCDAIAGPADRERRLEESDEIIALALGLGDRRMELLGRRLRLVALLETGQTGLAEAEVDAFAAVAEALRQPLYLWYVPLWRGLHALMRGQVAEAEAHNARAAAIGEQAHSDNAAMLTISQRWAILREQGRHDDALALLEETLGIFTQGGIEVWNAFALALGEAGRRAEAMALLDRAAAGELAAAAPSSEWLPMLAQLTDLVATVGGHPVAPLAYELLLPYRSRTAIDGIGASSYGSVERHLGILGAMLGRPEDAATHFDAALAANRRAGAVLLVAHTLRDAGRFLGHRGRLEDALHLYRELRLEYHSGAVERLLAEQSSPALGPRPSGANVFRREGEFWTLAWDGTTVRLKDAKGLHDLARLLAQPGSEVHVLELAGAQGSGLSTSRAKAERLGAPGHAGELLDEQARARYRARLAELEGELEEAEAAADPERAAQARAERDFLVDELTSAFGLGGRPRRTGDPSERARSTVTQRVRQALNRIERAHPALGRHLRRSVHTGTFCGYDPAEPQSWEL